MVAPPTTPRSFAVDVARASAAFQDLARQMGAQFLDKQEIIRLMTVSAIAGEHMVIVGPPGTAKSAMIDMFAKLIDARYFEYLLTRFTEPNELFGPVDISAFREGRYTRRLENMLPTAEIVFLDEIFKSNSAILNSLLHVINERKFQNGPEVVQVPLISLFAASNEVPNDDNLAAMFDRFLVRVLSRQPRQLSLPRADEEGRVARAPQDDRARRRRARPADRRAAPVISRARAAPDPAELRQVHGVPRGLPDQVQGAHLPDPQRGHLGVRSPRRQAAQAVRRVAPCSTAARASTTATSSSSATSGTTSTRSSCSRRSSNPVVDAYYREHPDERRFIGPSASLDDLLDRARPDPRAADLGRRALRHPAVLQLKNLNEIKVALAALPGDARRAHDPRGRPAARDRVRVVEVRPLINVEVGRA